MKELTEHLQKLTDNSTDKIIIHSAFNFIYGCCLVIHLANLGVFKPKITAINAQDKLKALLEALEKEFKHLYMMDLPEYELDNKTKEFINEKGVVVFKALVKDLTISKRKPPRYKGHISYQYIKAPVDNGLFINMLEEFFQQSF